MLNRIRIERCNRKKKSELSAYDAEYFLLTQIRTSRDTLPLFNVQIIVAMQDSQVCTVSDASVKHYRIGGY